MVKISSQRVGRLCSRKFTGLSLLLQSSYWWCPRDVLTNVWLSLVRKNPTTSIIIVILVLISGGIRFVQELRSSITICLNWLSCTVIREGAEAGTADWWLVVENIIKLSAENADSLQMYCCWIRVISLFSSPAWRAKRCSRKVCLAKSDGQNLDSLLNRVALWEPTLFPEELQLGCWWLAMGMMGAHWADA